MTYPYSIPVIVPPRPEDWDEMTLIMWNGKFAALFAPTLRAVEREAAPARCRRGACRRARRCQLADCNIPLPPRRQMAMDNITAELRRRDAAYWERLNSGPVWRPRKKTGKSAFRR